MKFLSRRMSLVSGLEYLTDGIHPNNAGHQAMADAVNLFLLLK